MNQLLKKKISEISDQLELNPNPASGLLTGYTGEAIFFLYMYRFTGNSKYKNILNNLVAKAIESFSGDFLIHTYCEGFVGLLTAINFCTEYGVLDEDNIIDLSEIDEYAHQFAKRDFNNRNWDFLHGGVGAMQYFLEHPEWEKKIQIINEQLDALLLLGEQHGQSLKWEAYPFMKKEGEVLPRDYNLGLAHGMPGVIAILNKCARKQIKADGCRIAIYKTIDFLFENRLPQDAKSIFPPAAFETMKEISPTRLAWCYGDLSISIILLQVAKTFHDKKLYNEGLEVALSTLSRDIEDATYNDAAICHGPAGIAHMYNRLHYITGDSRFKARINYWVTKTLDMATFEDGLAGYKFHTTSGYVNNRSVLEGVAGIGLSLVCIEGSIEPSWDKLLLLS